jgi:class 3 adenylate cyclase
MSHQENNVCCRNITIIARYVQNILGSDVLLLENLPYSVEYLKDEHNWIPLELYVQIMGRAIELLKDDEAPYKMGLSAQELESWGAFKYLQKVFGSVIFGPIEVYKQVGRYNEFFNRTKDLIVVKTGLDHCYVKIKFKNNVNSVDDFLSDAFIRGILCGVPNIWHLPPAKLEEPLFEYDLNHLLTKIGGVDATTIELRGDNYFVNGTACGKRVVLLSEFNYGEPLFLGQYREIKAGDNLFGFTLAILITKDLAINKKVVLKKGQIYNAPYFIYKLTWKPLSFWRKMYQLTIHSFLSKRAYREGIESQLTTIRNYVETLEDKVLKRTEQLNQAKAEAEFWRAKADNLLHTMLPQSIVEKMMKGKLLAEEINGTVVFTDLVGFTDFSRNLEPQQVADVLTKYFTGMSHTLTKHGGWVNKFMGDGILVLFGLTVEEDAAVNAVNAAIEMQKQMSHYTWKMRVGVASGKFIVGEFGTEDLRRFDCLGHIVNLASRLQSEAKEDEVLVCSRTHELLSGKFNFSEGKKISPKGIGEVEVYTVRNG